MSKHDLSSPVAVVTGAASDFGLELTKHCLKEGMHVVMADNAVTQLCDKVEQLSAATDKMVLAVVCDVTDIDQVKQLAKQTYHHFSHIDLFVNNANIPGRAAPLWELTHEHLRKVLDVNLHGVVQCLQTFLPLIFQQKERCHIVNVASLYGLCSGAQMSAYTMSQHALIALTESLYFDLKRTNKSIDVSVVCPSFSKVQTAHSAPLFSDKFHRMLSTIIQHKRSVEDMVKHIMLGIHEKQFYIFPDKKGIRSCKAHFDALLEQNKPYEYALQQQASISEHEETLNQFKI